MHALTAQRFPLTMNQEALWRFQAQLPSSDIYGMLGIACTRECADSVRMARAYDALLDRHPILRSGIVVDGNGESSCIIVGQGPATALSCIDGLAWDAVALSHFIEERFGRAHDTAGPTLFHAAMVTLRSTVAASVAVAGPAAMRSTGPVVTMLIFTAHHLVIDFLSFPLLLRDLEHLYRGAVAAPLPLPYAELGRWQRDHLTSEVTAGHVATYARHLSPLPPRLDFGMVATTPESASRSEERFAFPETSRAAVMRYASSVGMTPFAVMLAVFGIMLHRQTGADDLCVAVPMHGRPRRGFSGSVGYFANVVPVRQRIYPAHAFRDHAARTNANLRAALRLAAVPFPVLAARVDAYDVSPGRSVLCQVGMVWDAATAAEPDAWIDLLHTEQRGSAFALCLTGYVDRAQWVFGIRRDPALVPAAVVNEWITEFARVATLLCEQPDAPLRSMDLTSPPCWHAPPRDATALPAIEAALQARAWLEPQRVVLSQGDRRIPAGELEALTRRMALSLLDRAAPGDRMALFAERGCDSVLAMLAALRAGVAYVPLHPGQTQAWLAQVCEQASVRFMACSVALAARARAFGISMWTLPEWEAAEPTGSGELPDVPAHHEAYVVHTSGSTGAPKAVAVSRANLERMLEATRFIYSDSPQCWTLLHHSAFDFSVWEMWGPLVHGHALRVVDDATVADAARLHAEVIREGVTHMGMTPGAARLLVPHLRDHGAGALRTVCVGGAAVDRALVEAFARLGIAAWSFYGPTEATVWASCGRFDGAEPDGWIGFPFPGMRAYVLDSALRWVPPHRPGDLYLAGGQLAQYPGRPGLAAERFVPDPWHAGERMYRTGDRALYDDVSGLRFVGRDDSQVKVNGYRVELDGLAALLRSHHCFVDVACAHAPAGGITAFYATASGDALPAELLRAAAVDVLPAYVLPVQFVHQPAIPLNRNGKHDVEALLANQPSQQEAPALDSGSEAFWLDVILRFLHRELGASGASPETPFHELGAQSIVLARLHGELAGSAPGLMLEDLYAFPTPRLLALRLSGQSPTHSNAAHRIGTGPRRVSRRGGR